EHTLCLNWRKLLFIDTSYIKDYIHVSLPMLVTQTMRGASSIIQTAILGNMENAAMVVPATSISALVFQIWSRARYGAPSAAASMTGRMLGEGDKQRIDHAALSFHVIFCIIGVATGVIPLGTLRPCLHKLATLSPVAVAHSG